MVNKSIVYPLIMLFGIMLGIAYVTKSANEDLDYLMTRAADNAAYAYRLGCTERAHNPDTSISCEDEAKAFHSVIKHILKGDIKNVS